MAIFGRKKTSEQSPGHAAVLRTLNEKDKTDPNARLQLAGAVVFDMVCRIIQNERGTRIDDVLAILGATGGFSCIVSTMSVLTEANVTIQEAGLAVVKGADNQIYYFGDVPNKALLESKFSLLSLTLGAAHSLGAQVSLDLVHDTLKHVASTVGGAQFGIPILPEGHQPGDLPINYVKHLWPKIREALDTYEVPATRYHMALGFAIYKAIEAGKDAIDPLLAARIVTECAVPMAKLDPARFQ